MNAIEIQGLTKFFSMGFFKKSIRVLDDVSISVSEGEIFGFLGPNGAGKTTTLKIMLGLIRPSSGMITILGKNFTNIQVRQNLGYLPEQPYFYDYLTANEFLAFYGTLFGLKGSTMQTKAQTLLKVVGLDGVGQLALRKFSKGMLQRIGIAQALINDPRLIVLDEPMSGLDPIGRREVRDLILNLKREGRTIFFSSHIISDVEMICDRVAILNRGKIVVQGRINDFLSVPEMVREIEISGLNAEGGELIKSFGTVISQNSERILVRVSSDEEIEGVLQIAKEHGGKLVSLVPHKQSLEDLFTEKVGGKRER